VGRRLPLSQRRLVTLFALALCSLLVQSALASGSPRQALSKPAKTARALAAVAAPSGLLVEADAFVDSTKQNDSFGAEHNLSVSSPRTKYAYLRFRVTGLTAPVAKATVHVYSTLTTPGEFELWEITGAWGESVTWKDRPALGASPVKTFSVGGPSGWSSVDVTSLVRGNGEVNLALVAEKGKKLAHLASRESGTGAVLTLDTVTQTPAPSPPPPADTQPPSVPGSPTAAATGSTSIGLSWVASSDNVGVTGYGVYLAGALVGTGAGTSFSLSGLACGTTYSLAVDAYDAAGNRSAKASINASTSVCAPAPVVTTTVSAKDSIGMSSGGGLAWYSDADLARELDGYVAVGAKWLRLDLHWSVIERGGKGVFDWSKHDRLVDAARSRGLNLLGIIAYTPAWARNPACSTVSDKCEPARAQDFGDFAVEAVRRYSGRGMKHFELWNEPNIKPFWLPAPNAQNYAALVRTAYPRMKAVDPTITVMAGATSPAANNGTDIDPRTFLQTVYANGGGGNFDAWSHHPYYGPNRPADPYEWSAWYQMYGTKPSLRSLMEANGDSAKKIWATETGAIVGVTWSCCGTTTEESQATLLKEAFDLWRTYPWAGGLMYYNYHAHGGYSLTRDDWSLRPAWYAYRDYK
jgi:polysaccharide biosynthesis protein PslG